MPSTLTTPSQVLSHKDTLLCGKCLEPLVWYRHTEPCDQAHLKCPSRPLHLLSHCPHDGLEELPSMQFQVLSDPPDYT